MKPFRWLGAGLLWILAGLLGVVGGLLSVTIILLPLGIPILMLARRLFSMSGRLLLPRSVQHPVKEAGKALTGGGQDMKDAAKGGKKAVSRKSRKALKNTRDALPSPVDTVVPKPRRGLLGRMGIRR
jgi:hypothetical protein